MSKIRTLIVDDELHARNGVRTLLSSDPEIEIIGESNNGKQALNNIETLRPDLVLLDIQMPDLNGFDLLARLDLASSPVIVFVTAHDQYALKAFEFSAVDYLLKPFTDERFHQALERAKTLHRQRELSEVSTQLTQLRQLLSGYTFAKQPGAEIPTQFLQRFPVKTGGVVHFVPVDEVDWLEADGYCTKLHGGKQTFLLRGNLGSFESQLDPQKFARIHRSAIVNLRRIQCLKNWFHGEGLVQLQNGTELKVSSNQRQRLEQLLEHLA
ncbi:MAG: response regulator transcription factor [Acidobacteria bacterium]|nr:response regulator transcription factor [Acidobacteriota bacterium]